MKTQSLFYKLVTSLVLGMTACHPFTHAAAALQPLAQAMPIQELSTSATRYSRTNPLANGFAYTVVSAPEFSGLNVKLAVTLPPKFDEQALALLTQHALFYGTKQLPRSIIQDQLNELGFDVDADSHIQTNELEHSIQFSIANDQNSLEIILSLLQQLAFEPLLSSEAIEGARSHLLQNLTEEEDAQRSSLSHQIAALTQAQVRSFYTTWYRPSVMHLYLLGAAIDPSVEDRIEQLFGSLQESPITEEKARVHVAQLINQRLASIEEASLDTETNALSALLNQQVEFLSDQNVYVVDGKIWMNQPNWINKSTNGRLVGAFLTALGIGGIILALPLAPLAPVALPVILAAGSLSTVTGVYFLSCGYLKDPDYVFQKRREDLERGFEHAYRNYRAGVTLTPYERRYLFLQEMINYPAKLSKAPIVLLADLYDLTSPVLSELFLIEEMNFLVQSKLYYLQHRNYYKVLMGQLDQELSNLTAPYAKARDLNLAYVREAYNQNEFVMQKRAADKQLDENIEQIEQAYQDKKISLEERNSFIKEHKQAYQDYIHDAYFASGLAHADAALNQREVEILITYDYQVAQCKMAIQYDQRMAQYKMGKQALTYECDAALRNGLTNFPLSMPSLPDFVDLRR